MLMEIVNNFGMWFTNLWNDYGGFVVILTMIGAISVWCAITWIIGTCAEALFHKKES